MYFSLNRDACRERSVIRQLERCNLRLRGVRRNDHSSVLVVHNVAKGLTQLWKMNIGANATHLGQNPLAPDARTSTLAHNEKRVERRQYGV
jgi:hypothetical protein